MLELRFKSMSLGSFSDGKFIISQVKASDQGTYECVARNILGIGQIATLNLTVLGMYGMRKIIQDVNKLSSHLY